MCAALACIGILALTNGGMSGPVSLFTLAIIFPFWPVMRHQSLQVLSMFHFQGVGVCFVVFMCLGGERLNQGDFTARGAVQFPPVARAATANCDAARSNLVQEP